MIDAALGETFAEIAAQGSGVGTDDVVRASAERQERPRRRQSAERRESRTERVERDEQGRFLPRNERRSQSQTDEVDPYEALDAEEERPPADSRRRRPTRTSERDRDIEDDEDEDDDAIYDDDGEDEDDDYDDRPARRRRVASDDAEDEEDDFEQEARSRQEDDGDEDEDDAEETQTRRRNRPGRRKRFSKRIESTIAAEVQKRVGTTLAERDALREQESQRIRADAEAGRFLSEALGTPQVHAQLKAIAYNNALPARQRNDALNRLAAYERNSGFFEKYKSGAWAVIRYEQGKEDAAALKAMADLRPLDPKVLAEGNRAKTLVHAYATGRALGQREGEREIKRLRRLLANAKGDREDSRYRNGISGRRPTVASANGRRANGRVGQPDLLRSALGNDRGLDGTSHFPAPTEETLAALRRGDITLADLRLGKIAL
jgi:hypothetical protein